MPISFREVDGGLGYFWQASGILTTEDFAIRYEHLLSLSEDKQRAYRFHIGDYSAVTNTDISTSGIRQIASFGRAAYANNQDGLVVLLVPQDVLFGLSRMWSVYIGEQTWETEVFREREEALAWVRERARQKFGIEDLTFR